MNIQPSVIVWTVICFLFLMLILNNWLFKPVLRVIDARRERVENARTRNAAREQLAAEYSLELEKQTQQAFERAREESVRRSEEISQDGKKQIQRAQKERLHKVNSCRAQMQKDYEQIVGQASPEMEATAEIFANVIVSNRI